MGSGEFIRYFPAVISRLPLFILGLIVLLLPSEPTGQVSTVFASLTFGWQYFWGLAILICVSLSIVWVLPRRNWPLVLADILLFNLPLVVVLIEIAKRGDWYIAASVAAFLVAQVGFFLTQRKSPSPAALVVLFILLVGCWFGFNDALLSMPVGLPRFIGPLGLLALFLGLCALALTLATRYWPVGLPLVAVVAAVFFWSGSERPHYLAQTVVAGEEDAEHRMREVVNVKDIFHAWLSTRRDIDTYLNAGISYPVMVVLAEGGGAYAAAHTHAFLSKLQAACPLFAEHLFAVVGASGGAVGAAMFQADLVTSQWREGVPEGSELECDLDAKSSPDIAPHGAVDHLSPPLAAMLFQDFPNRLLFGALGEYDRADALAASFAEEARWNPLLWDDYWATTPGGEMTLNGGPALIQVATNALTGRRFVFAPFSMQMPSMGSRARFEESIRYHMGYRQRPRDIRIFDAVVASATFPYITPGQLLPLDEKAEGERDGDTIGQPSQEQTDTQSSGPDQDMFVQLVDGGYSDNSAASTALDLFTHLDDSEVKNGDSHSIVHEPSALASKCGRFVLFSADPDGSDETDCTYRFVPISIRASAPESGAVSATSFFLDPLSALLAVRSRLGETARFALLSAFCGQTDCSPEQEWAFQYGFFESVLDTGALGLPLAWYLSPQQVACIEANVAVAARPDNEACVKGGTEEEAGESFWGGMVDNANQFGMIVAELAPPPKRDEEPDDYQDDKACVCTSENQ
jgi:hypothetical protein